MSPAAGYTCEPSEWDRPGMGGFRSGSRSGTNRSGKVHPDLPIRDGSSPEPYTSGKRGPKSDTQRVCCQELVGQLMN